MNLHVERNHAYLRLLLSFSVSPAIYPSSTNRYISTASQPNRRFPEGLIWSEMQGDLFICIHRSPRLDVESLALVWYTETPIQVIRAAMGLTALVVGNIDCFFGC